MIPLIGSAAFSRSLTGPRSIHHLVSSNVEVFSSAIMTNTTKAALNPRCLKCEFLQRAFREQRINFGTLADQALLVGVLHQRLQHVAVRFQAVSPWVRAENFALFFYLLERAR